MVDCLTVAAGILARSQGVIKGTGADRRFVKTLLKYACCHRYIINICSDLLSISYNSQRLPFKSELYKKQEGIQDPFLFFIWIKQTSEQTIC